MPSGDISPTTAPWHARIITLYPDMFPGPLAASLAGTALTAGKWLLDTIDMRTFGLGTHKAVDDRPAGGGPGMVIRCDVAASAIDHAAQSTPDLPLIYLTPRGKPLTQAIVSQFAAGPGVIILAGRFEGIDQRVIDARPIQELSIGDYVLAGGELAAMVMIEACVRLLPGVVGSEASLHEESFSDRLLEYPQFTKPRNWEGREIPDVLLSGNHAKIAAWRKARALEITRQRRPDLLNATVPKADDDCDDG